MSRLTFLLIFPIAFFATFSFGQFGYQFSNSSQGVFLADIAMADSTTLFITGSNTYSTSVDGGNNWFTLSSSGMFTEAASFPSNKFGIVVGNEGKYRTNTQCGYFWGWSSNRYVGINRDLTDVHFTTERKGYVTGMLGTLVHTINQGTNWTIIPTGTTSNLNGVYCTNDSTAYACGENGTILKVVNNTVVSTQNITASPLNKIFFTDANTGYVVGNSGSIFKTTNGGNTWTFLTIPTTGNFTAIDFPSPSHGVICGEGSLLYLTTDAGATWTPAIKPPGTYDFLSIAFQTDSVGYVATSDYVMRTDDGGLNWYASQSTLRQIQFPTDEVGYALGYGLIQKTTDRGQTWKSSALYTGSYSGMHFINQDTGYVVGQQGKVSRTLDGAETWSMVTVPTTNLLHDVYFTDYLNGTIVGVNTVLRTTNGGQTWTSALTTTSTFYDVTFTSSLIGYACTATGKIYKTTNGGASWTLQTITNTTALYSLYFLSNTEGWAVGASGKIFYTNNGGTSWTPQTSGVTTSLRGIHIFDDLTGVAVGYAGTQLITENGGQTWQNRSLVSSTLDYNGLCFTDKYHGYSLGYTRVYTLGAYSLGVPQSPYCPYDSYGFGTFAPYFNNNTPSTAVFEIVGQHDDFANAQVMDTLAVDSVGHVDAILPNLAPGIYKMRLRQVDNPNHTSFQKMIRIAEAPTVSVSYSDSLLIAVPSSNDVTIQWFYRPTPTTIFDTYLGNNDTIAVTNTGEYRVKVSSTCCYTYSEWMYLENCNGQLHPAVTHEFEHTICQGDTLTVGSHQYFQSGVYYDTLTAANSCDSIVQTTLHVNPKKFTFPEIDICQGDSLFLEGAYRTTSGLYTDSLLSSVGCDSIVKTTLTVNPVFLTSHAVTICPSDSVLLEGNYQNTAGIYRDTLLSIHGCDSIIETTLALYPVYTTPLTAAICANDSIYLGGAYRNAAGTYYDTFPTIHGCDSILATTLTIYPVYTTPLTAVSCPGDSVYLAGSYLTIPGTYYDTLQTVNGCDSILATTYTHYPVYTTPLTAMICPDDSIYLQGDYRSIPGIYYDTLQTVHGCDSILATTLTHYPVYTTALTAAICPDDSMYLQGDYRSIPGIYYDTLQTIHGCDSILATTLTHYPVYTTALTAAICPNDSVYLAGDYQTAPGIYYDTLQTIHGCDSILVTTLSHYPVYTIPVTEIICSNDSIYLQGDYQTSPGTYYDTLQTIHGCDSIIQTTLQVIPFYQQNVSLAICQGDSIYLAGDYQTVAGIYEDELTAANGCDSLIVTTLSIHPLPQMPGISQAGGTLHCSSTGMATYEWFLNGVSTGCSTASCACEENGIYTVLVTDANGCEKLSNGFAVTGCDLSTPENTGLLIRVFPNPTTGQFEVDFGSVYAQAEVKVLDVHGRIINEHVLSNTQSALLELDAAPGIYYITVRADGNGPYLFRLVKQ